MAKKGHKRAGEKRRDENKRDEKRREQHGRKGKKTTKIQKQFMTHFDIEKESRTC